MPLLLLVVAPLVDGVKEGPPRDLREVKWLLKHLLDALGPFLREEEASREPPEPTTLKEVSRRKRSSIVTGQS